MPAVVVAAPSEAEVAQTVCAGETEAGPGKASRWTVTLEVAGGQAPLERVHRKVAGPVDKPLTAVVTEEELTIVAVPDNKDQTPLPVVGLVAASVAEVLHTVWPGPASAGPGS